MRLHRATRRCGCSPLSPVPSAELARRKKCPPTRASFSTSAKGVASCFARWQATAACSVPLGVSNVLRCNSRQVVAPLNQVVRGHRCPINPYRGNSMRCSSFSDSWVSCRQCQGCSFHSRIGQSTMCGGSSARLREMPNNAPATQRLRFEIPSPGLADSYRGLVQEFVDRGEQLIPFILSLPNELFSEFLRQLDAWSRGEDLPAGFVPHSTFWLVRDDVEVVGVSNLRHRLTYELKIDGGNIGYGIRPSARGRGFANVLLRNTLDRARAMGLAEALLTCGKGNYASASTIVRNGGVLVSEAFIESRGEIVQRYRIDLASTANAL